MGTKNAGQLEKVLACSSEEWLETTGTGGYAFSTASFANTRRYHGLLVIGSGPDDTRAVLVSRVDEVIRLRGESYPLGTRIFQDTCAPSGYQYISAVQHSPFPQVTFTIETAAGLMQMTRSVLAIHGTSMVLLRYQLLALPDPVVLELQPFVALRQYHSLQTDRDDSILFCHSNHSLTAWCEESDLSASVMLAGSSFTARGEWHRGLYYPLEESRGYDHVEDIFLPGVLQVSVSEGDSCYAVIARDAEHLSACTPEELWLKEIARREQQVSGAQTPAVAALIHAGEQLLCRDEAGRLDIVAGYPWFTCWARDTMIALPGLCLVTGRFSEAREILSNWTDVLSQGMLPNRLGTEKLEYNTVDGTLLYITAIYRYIEASGDFDFITEALYQSLKSVILHHMEGTRYGVHVDPEDCLLAAGSEQTQLTWMDACFDGIPVTPRWGKAVEVNALWYNALKIIANIAERLQEYDDAKLYEQLAGRVRHSFKEAFWLCEQQYLSDVIQNGVASQQIRPNQLFALSLPFPLLGTKQASQVLAIVRSRLLTPCGLRTLAPEDPEYIGQYKGSLRDRDYAYHQGTVWPWLFAPFATAVLRFEGADGRAEIEKLFDGSLNMLASGVVGSVSEVFDGDEPRTAAGCVAQAWSVAALLEMAASLRRL